MWKNAQLGRYIGTSNGSLIDLTIVGQRTKLLESLTWMVSGWNYEEEIGSEPINYFATLFKFNRPKNEDIDSMLEGIESKISWNQN